MSRPYFTDTDRRLGAVSALTAFIVLLAYAITLTIGLLTLPSPQEPIRGPIFSLLELLIIIVAPLMVVAMAAVHAYAAPEARGASRVALALMIVLAGITCSVHFVILTISRHPAAAALPPVFLSFTWPSFAYALDILAWDVFFALSMLCGAFVFAGDRLSAWLRGSMLVSGGLSLAGLIGVPLGDMQIRLIGVAGYAGVSLVVFPLLAVLFLRARGVAGKALPRAE